jgi:hypothetical protein
MAEKPPPRWMRPGVHLDPTPFTLDLYRLLCMVLADQRVVNLDTGHFSDEISELRGDHFSGEFLRILISSAVALRIAFDQYPQLEELKTDCGKLYPNWPKEKRKRVVLTLRDACNKIIHADKVHHDIVDPHPGRNPDQEGAYLGPYLYLYGKKKKQDWRAELSIINFVKWGAVVFLKIGGRR